MKSFWQILMMVTFLIKFEPNFSQNMNQFEKLWINGSADLTVSEQFRSAYSLYTVQGLSLLKCASFCSSKNNCLFFSKKNVENNFQCEFFSSQNLDDSEMVSKSFSSVYRKRLNNLDATLTTTATTTITTTTIADYTCLGNDCSCSDNMSYFSKSLSKCVKCRDGWLGYKNVCYKGFTDTKNWQNFVDFCASLNSTLIIADNDEKFKFFQGVSKNLTLINNQQRTWVYARYDVINEFKWMNSKPINISNIMQNTLSNGCFAYFTTPNSYLSVTWCGAGSNGICEYDY